MNAPVSKQSVARPAGLAVLLLALAAVAAASAADKVLFDFSGQLALARFIPTDATVSDVQAGAGHALRVSTGHRQPWPGIRLQAPGSRWDLSPFAEVALTVANRGTNPVTLCCRVDSPKTRDGEHTLTEPLRLEPGKSGVLKVSLKRFSNDKLDGKLFGMRGYPVASGGPGTLDPANITQLLIFIPKPAADHCFEVSDIHAAGTYTPPTAWTSDAAPFFPFIDTFGQYRHKDWPGKVKSLADLAARREQEAAELAAKPGPADWDQYGGWAKGPQLQASGFFRVQQVRGKWWLVDPDGRLFFSHGIDCVGQRDLTAIEGRETWFDDFPARQPQFSEFLSHGFALKGHYAGRSPEAFCFAGANLKRKYGPGWDRASAELAQQRLRSWGLNTIGNWSAASVCRLRRTPYTDTLGTGRCQLIEGSEGYWARFPDVFAPGFAEALRQDMAGKRGKSVGDPWCLGYFCNNEMSWGRDGLSLAVAALKSPPEQPAKQAFLADLKAKYIEIDALNRAWDTKHASWAALLASKEAPAPERARDDLAAFYTRLAEQYFRTVRDAIKAVAPHQLYLGCRFADGNARAAAAAAKYCDVVSYNLYRRGVADFCAEGATNAPLLIGEFHFGALDRGMFHTGLVPVAGQSVRARACQDYVRSALAHPQFVGCHWFLYQDEPTTGRVLDEENYQIGFVDVADSPYPETIQASREVGYHLYGSAP